MKTIVRSGAAWMLAMAGAFGPAAGAMAATPPLPVAQVLGAQPIYREIKDWVVACDNTRACFAKYVGADEGAAGGGYLSIARDAGPRGKLVVAIDAQEDQTSPPGQGALRLDGRPLGTFAWTASSKDADIVLEGDAAVAFIRAIRDGDKLADSEAKDAPFVSLSGMKAALLAMDDDQGRVGGETALVSVGPKPSSAVLAALPVPVVHASPIRDDLPRPAAFAASVRRARAEVLKAHDCEPEAASNDEAHALDAQNALVLLGCIDGAYQDSVITFEAPRTEPAQARLLVLPLQPTNSPANIPLDLRGEYVAAGGWDAASASLSESAKGRGVADCGSSSTWTFDGKAFQLTAYTALNRCGGGPPGDWPTIYRTRVVAR